MRCSPVSNVAVNVLKEDTVEPISYVRPTTMGRLYRGCRASTKGILRLNIK